MWSSPSRAAFGVRAATALTVFVLLWRPVPVAAAARDARDVALVDQTNATFTLRQLHRPAAVIFVDTACDDACPVAEGIFAQLAETIRRTRVDARLVTVTLDPVREPPLVMAAAARRFRADPARWRWASGKPHDVEDLMHAFGVVHVSTRIHSTFAYVLDARGLPMGVVPLSTSAGSQLLFALRAAARRG